MTRRSFFRNLFAAVTAVAAAPTLAAFVPRARYAYPSATNYFVPNWDATHGISVIVLRAKKDFKLTKWMQVIPERK